MKYFNKIAELSIHELIGGAGGTAAGFIGGTKLYTDAIFQDGRWHGAMADAFNGNEKAIDKLVRNRRIAGVAGAGALGYLGYKLLEPRQPKQ